MLVRQLEEELRMLRMRGPSLEMQQQMEILLQENEHLTREIAILRDTIKELELRIETQKQTLQARDESIKKLLEMLQNKGMGKYSTSHLHISRVSFFFIALEISGCVCMLRYRLSYKN